MQNTDMESHEEMLRALDEIVAVDSEPQKERKPGKRSSILKRMEEPVTEDLLCRRKSFNSKRVSFADKFQVMEMHTGNIYDISGKSNSTLRKDSSELEDPALDYCDYNPENSVFGSVSRRNICFSSSVNVNVTEDENVSRSSLAMKHKIDSDSDLEPGRKKLLLKKISSCSGIENTFTDSIEIKNHVLRHISDDHYDKENQFSEATLQKNSLSDNSLFQSNVRCRSQRNAKQMVSNDLGVLQTKNISQERSIPHEIKEKKSRKIAQEFSEHKGSILPVTENEKNTYLTNKAQDAKLYPLLLTENLLVESKENLFIDQKNKSILITNPEHLKLKDYKSEIFDKNSCSHLKLSDVGNCVPDTSERKKSLGAGENSHSNKSCILTTPMDFTCVSEMNNTKDSDSFSFHGDVVSEDPLQHNPSSILQEDVLQKEMKRDQGDKTILNITHMDLTLNLQNFSNVSPDIMGSSKKTPMVAFSHGLTSEVMQLFTSKASSKTSCVMDMTCDPQDLSNMELDSSEISVKDSVIFETSKHITESQPLRVLSKKINDASYLQNQFHSTDKTTKDKTCMLYCSMQVTCVQSDTNFAHGFDNSMEGNYIEKENPFKSVNSLENDGVNNHKNPTLMNNLDYKHLDESKFDTFHCMESTCNVQNIASELSEMESKSMHCMESTCNVQNIASELSEMESKSMHNTLDPCSVLVSEEDEKNCFEFIHLNEEKCTARDMKKYDIEDSNEKNLLKEDLKKIDISGNCQSSNLDTKETLITINEQKNSNPKKLEEFLFFGKNVGGNLLNKIEGRLDGESSTSASNQSIQNPDAFSKKVDKEAEEIVTPQLTSSRNQTHDETNCSILDVFDENLLKCGKDEFLYAESTPEPTCSEKNEKTAELDRPVENKSVSSKIFTRTSTRNEVQSDACPHFVPDNDSLGIKKSGVQSHTNSSSPNIVFFLKALKDMNKALPIDDSVCNLPEVFFSMKKQALARSSCSNLRKSESTRNHIRQVLNTCNEELSFISESRKNSASICGLSAVPSPSSAITSGDNTPLTATQMTRSASKTVTKKLFSTKCPSKYCEEDGDTVSLQVLSSEMQCGTLKSVELPQRNFPSDENNSGVKDMLEETRGKEKVSSVQETEKVLEDCSQIAEEGALTTNKGKEEQNRGERKQRLKVQEARLDEENEILKKKDRRKQRDEREEVKRKDEEKQMLEAEKARREEEKKLLAEYEKQKEIEQQKKREELERKEKQRLEEERLEKEKKMLEEKEKQRLEAERLEKEKKMKEEKQRLEEERLEKEKNMLEEKEKQRLEAEKLEKEKKMNEEKQRLEAEKLEKEKKMLEEKEKQRQIQLKKEEEEQKRKEEKKLKLEIEIERLKEEKRILEDKVEQKQIQQKKEEEEQKRQEEEEQLRLKAEKEKLENENQKLQEKEREERKRKEDNEKQRLEAKKARLEEENHQKNMEDDYEIIHTLRKKMIEASEDEDWLLQQMDDERAVFIILYDSLFASYVMDISLKREADVLTCVTVSFHHNKKDHLIDEIDKIGYMLFKTRVDSALSLSSFSFEELPDILSKLQDFAMQAQSLVSDIWVIILRNKTYFDFSQSMPKIIVEIADYEVLDSRYSLTFPIDLKSYPCEKIIPEVKHLDYEEISPEIILEPISKVQPGEYYLSNMVNSVKH